MRQIDITVRGQEVTLLARWILRRLKVERAKVEKMKLPTCADGEGDEVAEDGNMEGAEIGRRKPPLGPKKVAKWERVRSIEGRTRKQGNDESVVTKLYLPFMMFHQHLFENQYS